MTMSHVVSGSTPDAENAGDPSLRALTGPAHGPLQIELRFQIDLPPDKAFDLLAVRLPEWFGAIHEVSFDNTHSERGPGEIGACSTRACSFGDRVLREEIVAFQPGRHYAYRADLARSTMKMPIRQHLGTMDLEGTGGTSIVTWRQYFQAPLWPFGALIRWYMRDRLMRPALRVLFGKHGGRLVK